MFSPLSSSLYFLSLLTEIKAEQSIDTFVWFQGVSMTGSPDLRETAMVVMMPMLRPLNRQTPLGHFNPVQATILNSFSCKLVTSSMAIVAMMKILRPFDRETPLGHFDPVLAKIWP